MTQEEKQLLLVDLCGRLPYGVKIHMPDLWINEARVEVLNEIFKVSNASYCVNDSGMPIEHIKPYLFPLSSMTKEQSKIYHELIGGMFGTSALINFVVLEEFFNKNHLDYRGLIPMGLANDATGLNIY